MKVYKIKKFSDYKSEKILQAHGYKVNFNLLEHPEAPYMVFKTKDLKSFDGQRKIGEKVIFSKSFKMFNLNDALKFLNADSYGFYKGNYKRFEAAGNNLYIVLKSGQIYPATFTNEVLFACYNSKDPIDYLMIVDPFGKKFNRFEMRLIHDALKFASCGDAKKQADFVEWISMAIAFRSMNGGSLPYEKAYKAYLRRINNEKNK